MLFILTLLSHLYASPEIEMPTLARYAIESLDSKRAFLFYAALTGATTDTLRALNQDLTRSFGATGLPRLRLENGEFFVNDQASGVRVTSYQPFNISYRREIWSPLPRAPIEMNMASLRKILKKRSARLSLMPEAYAEESGTEDVVSAAGALLASMTEVTKQHDDLMVGVSYGWVSWHKGPINKDVVAKWIASPEFVMSCDDEETVITNGDHRRNVSAIVIDNRSIYGYDHRSRKVDLDLKPAEMIELRKLRKCDKATKAKAFTTAVRQAATAAQNAIAQTTAPEPSLIQPASATH